MSLQPDQPREIARLLNPAFCAALLQRACEGYVEAAAMGMPFSLMYLVLPLVLHEPTRQSLPTSKSTKFATWIARHPEVRAGFVERTRALLPYTTAGLGLLLKANVIRLDGAKVLRTSVSIKKRTVYPNASSDVGDCWSRAALLGRILPSVPRVSRVFVSLGVRP